MYQPRSFEGEPTGPPRDLWGNTLQTPADFWIDLAKGVVISATLFCIFAMAMWNPKDPTK